MELGYAPTMPRSNPFAPKVLPHHFGGICEDWVIQFCKSMIFVFHPTQHQVSKSSQNTKIMELGFTPTMPRSIPFAPKHLAHHFGGICEGWVQTVFQNHDFHFSPNTPPSHQINPKHQNHGTWLCTNHAKINSFCSETFPTWLWRHLWGLSQPIFQNHDFRFSPNTPPSHKIKPTHQNHGTWLCTNHAKINYFCSQTSPT